MINADTLEGVESIDDLTDEAQTVLEGLDFEHLKERLTGRDGGLRPSKPRAQGDTGLEQYVWRMARFHSGDDPKMPVTAEFDLYGYLREEGLMPESGGYREDHVRQIEAILDVVARAVVADFGRNPDAGIGRWAKAIYG